MLRFLRIERPTIATLRPDLDGDVDRLLHPVDVRRERRDENAARALRDDLPERLADEALGAGDAGPLGVRRVAEQEIDAAVAELGEPPDVGLHPVHRRVVDLAVGGVEDAARRRLEQRRRRCPAPSAPSARTRAGTGRSRPGRPRADLAQLGGAQSRARRAST